MSLRYATEGFVFKKEDRMDSDRLFSVFTKDFGRIEVLGKAIRKIDSKLKSGIEFFSFSDIEFIQGKNTKTLTDAVFTNRLTVLDSLDAFALSCKISEMLDNFVKGEESDERIFDLISRTLKKIQGHRANQQTCSLIFYYFFWNFVSDLGYRPELLHCAICRQKLNPYGLYFSDKEGGIICARCSVIKKDGVKIKSDIVKILKLILQNNWDILVKLKMVKTVNRQMLTITNSYYKYLCNEIQ